MKNSVFLFLAFLLGGVISYYLSFPVHLDFDLNSLILGCLMFAVGLHTGSNKGFFSMIRGINYHLLMFPVITVVGTFIGILAYSAIFRDIRVHELLAVGSGFGYYSLSSMIIAKVSGESLALLALLSNIFREIMTIVLTPLLVRYTGGMSPIVSAGATSMDTSLPVIIRYAGHTYAFPAVFNGVVLTLLVPFLVIFFLGL